jgi:dihydrofolate reductase
MSLSLIVAMTPERVIGRHNQLPWHIPDDLKRFKKITMGHPLIMGRKTFESIGKPLPGRQNVVVSRNPGYYVDGVVMAQSLDDALQKCDVSTGEEFVIGGAELFSTALPLAHKIYLTMIHQEIPGDVFFPEFNEQTFSWTTVGAAETDGLESLRCTFMEGVRRPT